MPRWVLGDLSTGDITADLNTSSSTWAENLNAAGSFQAAVPMWQYIDFSSGRRSLDVRSKSTPRRTFLAAIDDETERVLCAGPVLGRPWDGPSSTVTIQGTGLWAYWYWRVLAPALTGDQRLTDVDTSYSGLSLGSIAVSIVQQSMGWAGGMLPIDFPDLIPGSSERDYPGSDAAYIGDRLAQLVGVQGGPDIMFKPYFNGPQNIRWQMVTGTDEDPFIHGSGTPVFDYSAPDNGVSGLAVAEDASNVVNSAFVSSGDSDTTLIGQSFDETLLDLGYPALQSVSSRSSVTEMSTLDGYATAATNAGRNPFEAWTAKFQRRERPYLQDYSVGDWVKLRVQGDPWIPDGTYDKRIIALSGDGKDTEVSVTFMGDGDLQSYIDRDSSS